MTSYGVMAPKDHGQSVLPVRCAFLMSDSLCLVYGYIYWVNHQSRALVCATKTWHCSSRLDDDRRFERQYTFEATLRDPFVHESNLGRWKFGPFAANFSRFTCLIPTCCQTYVPIASGDSRVTIALPFCQPGKGGTCGRGHLWCCVPRILQPLVALACIYLVQSEMTGSGFILPTAQVSHTRLQFSHFFKSHFHPLLHFPSNSIRFLAISCKWNN